MTSHPLPPFSQPLFLTTILPLLHTLLRTNPDNGHLTIMVGLPLSLSF